MHSDRIGEQKRRSFRTRFKKLAPCKLGNRDRFLVRVSSRQSDGRAFYSDNNITATTACCKPANPWFQKFALKGQFHVPDLHKTGFWKVKLWRPTFNLAYPGFVPMSGSITAAYIRSCPGYPEQNCRTCNSGKIESGLFSVNKDGWIWTGGMNIDCGHNLVKIVDWATKRKAVPDTTSTQCQSSWEELSC